MPAQKFHAMIHFIIPTDHPKRDEGYIGGYVNMYGKFETWEQCGAALNQHLHEIGYVFI